MFSNGIFPNALKIAKVIPTHKSGSKQAVEIIDQSHYFRPFQKLSKK